MTEKQLKLHYDHPEENRVQDKLELQKIKDELKLFIDNFPGLIFYKDTQNNYIRVNKNLADAHDLLKKELEGKNLFELYPHKEAQKYWDDDLKVIKEKKPRLGIIEPWDTKEGRRWVKTNKIPLKNSEGEITGILGISMDITEQLRLEEELRKNEKLAVLGKLTGGIGHELRNPLGAIKNAVFFLNMVLEDAESDVKESLAIIEEEVQNSERIISSLLSYARPQPLELKKIHLSELFHHILTRISFSPKIHIHNHIPENHPSLLGDSTQLIQVFNNLIYNAIQAMPDGGDLTLITRLEDFKWIIISVIDTGVGITEEKLKKLFEPLYTTKAKGIGLGLIICKTIVEAHGGKIEVKSTFGQGTELQVYLPLIKEE